MDYLKAVQYIPHVDLQDNIIGKVERWEAHKKGILHRAFTISIKYKDYFILQHRKHPVFDSVYDLSISSHPLYTGDSLEDILTAIYRTLKREWHLDKEHLTNKPYYVGKCHYQAKDTLSEYQEHEICHIYTCEVKELSLPDFETAYGFSLYTKDQIKDATNPLFSLLAPWVHSMIKEGLL